MKDIRGRCGDLVVGLLDLMKGPWGRCGGLVVGLVASLLDLMKGPWGDVVVWL